MTQLYLRLLEALRRLDFADTAFAPIEALVPRENSVIDVRTLGELGAEGGSTLVVRGTSGRTASLQRADVAALTAELTIFLKDKPWDFFEHTDLLDFPGARSREAIEEPHEYLKQREKLPGLFLRGKVAYLFQRYSAEQELTAMLLCIGPSNQEVRTLPAMVKEWIDATHGNEPADRARQATALFLVLTKFDAEFEDKAGQSDSSDLRWTTRLNASLVDFFGKAYDWPHEWVPGQPFNNTVWLRNPNFRAKHMLDYDESGVEIGIRAGEGLRMARWKQEYLANASVRGHFRDPERAWDEAMRLNDGGVSYIAELLRPVCNPEIKRRQIEGRTRDLARLLADRLARYYVSGDLEAELKKRREQARGVSRSLVQCASDQHFGHLLKAMQIGPDLLSDLFFRIETEPAGGNGAAPVGKRVAAEELWGQIFGEYNAPGLGEARPADQADSFAELALAEWTQCLRRFSEDPEAERFFRMPQDHRVALANELMEGAQRRALRETIAGRVRKVVSFRQKLESAAAKPVMIAGDIINGYVDYLGYDQAPLEARPVAGKERRPVFAPAPPAGEFPELGEEPAAYDQDYYVDWITAFLALVEDNVRGQGGARIDVAANEKLGRLLQQLAAVKGST